LRNQLCCKQIKIKPEDNRSNMQNRNDGTSRVTKQHQQDQENRNKQRASNQTAREADKAENKK
jgi:hypothetical protein